MIIANSPTPPKDRWRMRPLLFIGYLTVFTLVFGLGAWAAVTKIAGAVVSAGSLEVEGKRQVIQHSTGGIIAAINARNGDEVVAGQVLVELDGEDLGPELDTVEGQWFEIIARKSRLDAERDLLDSITFHPELVARQDDPAIADLMRAQQQQFDARRKLQADESAQINEQQVQIAKQNEGLEALAASTRDQVTLIKKEIAAQQTLMDQGLTQMTRLLTPQRELARLQGTAGQVEASLAENRGKIAELEIELVRLTSKVREEAIAELRELEFREIELRENRRSLKEQIAAARPARALVGHRLRLGRRHAARGDPRRRAGDVRGAEGRAADRQGPRRDHPHRPGASRPGGDRCASRPSTSGRRRRSRGT